MELHLSATDQISQFDGVPCRVWEGTTERGIPCRVYVHHLSSQDKHDCHLLEQELHECMPVSRWVSGS